MPKAAVIFTTITLLVAPAPTPADHPPKTDTTPQATVTAGSGVDADSATPAGSGAVVECGNLAVTGLNRACTTTSPSPELDEAETARLRDAVRLFAEQGLRLPKVTVSFHESVEGCKGHYGLYDPETHHVHVCSDADHILPHELAHAWMTENLDEATEQAFLDLRGLDAWADPDDEWRARGVEDAAILIRMVLTENGGPENSPGWSQRRRAFELLTGKPHQVIDHRPKPGRSPVQGTSGHQPSSGGFVGCGVGWNEVLGNCW